MWDDGALGISHAVQGVSGGSQKSKVIISLPAGILAMPLTMMEEIDAS